MTWQVRRQLATIRDECLVSGVTAGNTHMRRQTGTTRGALSLERQSIDRRGATFAMGSEALGLQIN